MIISENIGGQASESWAIENYMGYRMITGDDLMRKFEEQVRSLDLHLEIDKVLILNRSGNEFIVNTATGAAYRARAVILAQGKQPRKLGAEGEERYLGRGSRSVQPATDRSSGTRWLPLSEVGILHSRLPSR